MAEHEAMIRAFAEGFSQRDISKVRAWMHDDVVFDWSRSISDNRGVHQGFGEIERLFENFIEVWESVTWRVFDVEEVGRDQLLVGTRMDVRGRDSGIEISGSGAQVWDMRDGKIARVTLFQSRGEAEAALAGGDLS
jgi:ketosteroid isomerase-like protein